jgi:hypothetical protein
MELDCEPLATLRLPLRAWRYSGMIEERSEEIRRGGDGRTRVVEEEGSGREKGSKRVQLETRRGEAEGCVKPSGGAGGKGGP